jgi:putative DNA primase/helicase
MIKRVTGRYHYHSENGDLLYWKERIEPGSNGSAKEFRFYHGNKQTGRGGDSVLYHLPDVIRSKYVIINEGEKQADLLKKWGLCATSLDSGAGSKLTEPMITHLTNKRIAILQDNDKPGTLYALKLAKALQGKYESLRIVLLPDLPDKGDICDWKGDKAQLLDIIKATPEWEPEPEVKKVEHIRKSSDYKGDITHEMIEAAKLYPIDRLIEFANGKALSFCHNDKNPSMTLSSKYNQCRCFVCGKSFSSIDILMIRDSKTFLEAVRELC